MTESIMDAREFLGQLKKLDQMIQNKLVEKKQWLQISMGTSGQSDGERVQSSGSKEKMADAVVKALEMEDEINAYIDMLVDTKKDILNVIERLNAKEYDFIHKHYVQGFALKKIASMKHKSYSWATTMHGNALKNVQAILDGRGKSNANNI